MSSNPKNQKAPIWRIVIALLALLPGMANCAEAMPGVVVLLSENAPVYRSVAEALSNQLADAPVTVRVVTLSADPDAAAEPGRHIQMGEPRLLITVGTEAARYATRTVPAATPVIRVFIPRVTDAALGSAPETSAIYLDQPLERQFTFIRELLPMARSVGTVLGPASAPHRGALEAAAAASDLRLRVAVAETDDEVVEAIRTVVRESEVILVYPDAELLTPERAKWLLYMAYRRGRPVIGLSAPYVEAGALGAIYSTPEQIARQAAERIRTMSRSGDWRPGDPVPPKYFETALNRFVARSLGITIPDPKRLTARIKQREQQP